MVIHGLGSPSLLVRLLLALHPLLVRLMIISYIVHWLSGERVATPVLLLVIVAMMLPVLIAVMFGPSAI